jgi:hypothetical protein
MQSRKEGEGGIFNSEFLFLTYNTDNSADFRIPRKSRKLHGIKVSGQKIILHGMSKNYSVITHSVQHIQ